MTEEILVNIHPREVRIALIENAILQEVYIERSVQQGLLGNIYKGKVTRILSGLQAAFIDIGLERAAFLHVKDILGYSEGKTIHDLLKTGQEVLVQAYKDQLGTKGARLTTALTVPSRYLVLTPGVNQITFSQKITDETERQRLSNMMVPGASGGYIFRTAAVKATQAELDFDKNFLESLWVELKERASKAKPGQIIYEEIPMVLRIVRDLAGRDVEKIRVDDENTFKIMHEFAAKYIPTLVERIEYHQSKSPLFDLYSVEDELQKALQRRVYLKSGAHLVFDQTEAMTTIDVNTGSYLGSGNSEKTVYKTNLEAIDAIARQIRLRNIGGIIIIDFIDMNNPSHKEHILQTLKTTFAKDPARIQISELSSLGLVQLTRKRSRESLEHLLCVTCPLCHKRGSIKSIETVIYEICREIRRVAQIYSWTGFLIVAAPQIVNSLTNEEAALLAELEKQLGKTIKFKVELSFTQEHYNILPL